MNQPGLEKVLSRIINGTLLKSTPSGLTGEIKRNVDFVILDHLMSLAINKNASPGAQSISMAMVGKLEDQLKRARGKSDRDKAHSSMLQKRINLFLNEPDDYEPVKVLTAPPGSPIGTEFGCTFENTFINISN